jgi:hypothetical protein
VAVGLPASVSWAVGPPASVSKVVSLPGLAVGPLTSIPGVV